MKKMLLAWLLALAIAGCGGGGGGTAPSTQTGSSSGNSTVQQPATTTTALAQNTVAVTVDSTYAQLNTPYVTLTVCAPGTSNCTTIDHVLVDTGSTGLRLLRSALPSSLGLANSTNPNTGLPLAECSEFGSGHSWGPISSVDLKIAGETASSLPIQIIDDSFATVPADCAGFGADMAANGAQSLGAKGILGVSSLRRDCNSLCLSVAQTIYYDCVGQICHAVTMPISDQVPNPATRFASDNNGVVLTFPGIPATGSALVTGTMTFGIDTQPDNTMASSLTQLTHSDSALSASYGGQTMNGIIDSGSGAYFFPDATITQCPTTFSSQAYYCPTSALTLTAALGGSNGSMITGVTFSIANAMSTMVNNSFVAYNNIGVDTNLFGQAYLDLGMPFFYGKTIYFGIQSNDILDLGTMPYWAIQS
ncbi:MULTISPECIES: DUF3443 family protein [Paraburkholderia]|uniref:DUF3443 domain-containing protein n=1 Tax=Paraburkholderia madseniana TaxID=2599607 RepID=A0AAP5ETV4_9BURK|nr:MULTISPECIES: DUF3443 family protein [Paraburkholderia]MCX4151688.1 DUF3443 family protein [Paraburkholderia madseniana]MCX4176963.1 DUF3443 family protein [Paraburkholderia madseniana]MDN7154616.1 DUF3443 domain-containing protein [Paraburkholderia sp. WS6]MDQ6413499.1 DUF3443 domain-containing protein [Paraburkholderia madseniana]MDQ6464953.1 DUF3443 domain-containing protein [Paraburkholderia madseniana]